MQFIVAEISCNYTNGELEAPEMGFLAERFERIINKNWKRGYKLFQFNISSFLNKWEGLNGDKNETLNETIIAVFEKITDQQPQTTTNKGQNNA